MGFFEWREDYSVGISLIDRQHRKIIELMNDLFESLRDKREELIIRDVLKELKDYSGYHFGLEAKLFQKYGYEKAEAHLQEHAHFVDKVAALLSEASVGISYVPIETLEYLRDWFQNHMLKVDREYSAFFAKKQVIEEIESAAP